jgi:flagellar biosynthetic protein FlhB
MAAPAVVAKGADHMARRIRETALSHDVPLVENKPLARSLYKATEIGDPVPVELYQAIAEVLAYVYRLKGIRSPG